jgi:AraC family transcriptional regulator of adaptative response/methylated-DNA-[protein]-cysteine methyltransferase
MRGSTGVATRTEAARAVRAQPALATPGAEETDRRWAAVLARDSRADGSFVYGVTSTGIYCRPACPSRRPLRRHVRFHDTAAEAERAGFRPCRRCRPDRLLPGHRHASLVAAACRQIAASARPLSLEVLARRAGLSPHHFHRVFRSLTGLTPRSYAAAHRVPRVRRALARNATVTEAIYDAGFASGGRFYETAPDMLGMTPTAFRAGGAEVEMHVAVGECSLGSVLVARSRKGVCAILLGDDPDALVGDLQDRFPRARLLPGDPGFDAVVSRVIAFVDAPALGLDLPLDIRGTAFQQRVWQALRQIPAGSTASYAEIARRIGAPTSTRAVAQACAANPLAVAIPCHRVVRRDGGLSGYRWGIERKRQLLDSERRR